MAPRGPRKKPRPPRRLVVVGGDAAGMSAAAQARRRDPDLQVVVLERSHHVSYAACGIPYYVGRVVEDIDRLVRRTPQDFARQGVEARLLTEAVELNLARREVVYRRLPGGEEGREPFDELLLATGSEPLRPNLPGIEAEGVFGMHTLDDARHLREALDQRRPRRVAVAGTGYVGLEMADAFHRLGLEVDLIGRSAQVMGTLDDEMGALVSEAVRGMGVSTHLGEEVQGFETAEGRVRAVVTDARTLATDLVLLGLGVRPNSALAAEAGLALGVRGSIRSMRG